MGKSSGETSLSFLFLGRMKVCGAFDGEKEGKESKAAEREQLCIIAVT